MNTCETCDHETPNLAEETMAELEDEVSGKADLLGSWEDIGPNARKALVMIARRMVQGRERYQEDFDKGRDWDKEAREEFLDGAIYLAVGATK